MTLDELESILTKVYDKETANSKSNYSKENPTCGQCVPTALLIQHYFGGEIYKHNIESHNFNIIDNQVVDLTKAQFNYKLDYTKSKPKQPDLYHNDTLARYNLLKERVEKYIKNNDR